MRILPMVFALSMLPSIAPAQPAGTASRHLSPNEQSILDLHNRERAAVGAPSLRWNAQLARDATDHAQQLARTGRLVHAPREGRGIVRENLSQGMLGWGPDQLMRNWLDEKRNFHGGIYPNVCTGGWSQCSHYTQVIWPGTTDVGCGVAAGGRFTWMVCRYSPGGNKDGRSLGVAASSIVGGPKGPIGSAKSRQRLDTPVQSRTHSNLEVLCASSAKELKSLRARIEELNARRSALAAEMKRVQSAIAAEQAGLANYDPSLLEKLLGTAQAPSNQKMAALSRYLAELQADWRSIQAELKAILARIEEIGAGSGPCRRDGERRDVDEVRQP